jgi:hypothetical protein
MMNSVDCEKEMELNEITHINLWSAFEGAGFEASDANGL